MLHVIFELPARNERLLALLPCVLSFLHVDLALCICVHILLKAVAQSVLMLLRELLDICKLHKKCAELIMQTAKCFEKMGKG